MIRARIRLAALAAALALGACGNSPELGGGTNEALGATRARLAARSADTEPLRPTPGFPGLDPALIAAQTVPIMGAYLEAREAVAGLYIGGRSAGIVAWRTADAVGLSLSESGILVSTRGLGEDLMASDSRQSAALIAAGRAGTAERRHVYLDGTFREHSLRLTCTVQPAGPEVLVLNGRTLRTLRIDEHCAGGGHAFVNRYWRDAGGPLIRQSSQWVGPQAGTLHLQRLIE